MATTRRGLFKTIGAALAVAALVNVAPPVASVQAEEPAPEPPAPALTPPSLPLTVAVYEGRRWEHTHQLAPHDFGYGSSHPLGSHTHSISPHSHEHTGATAYPEPSIPLGSMAYFLSDAPIPAGWRAAPELMGRLVGGDNHAL